MRKAWVVARHEFAVTVKRVWFLISTFVLPVFMLGVGAGMLYLGKEVAEDEALAVTEKPLGVVDLWGGLASTPQTLRVSRYADEMGAREAMKAGAIGAYIVVPPDYLENGRIKSVCTRRPTLISASRPPVPPGLGPWLIENVLARFDPLRVRRAQLPYLADEVFLDEMGRVSSEDPRETLKRSATAYAFVFLMFMSIFTSGAYLLQGLAEEKENRVMEIVLSSVTPSELMAGKLAGLGAAGLLQLVIWVMMGGGGAAVFAIDLALAPGMFAFCLLFFLLGYLLFGSLMLGTGALGTNLRETQQLASVWSLIAAAPWFVMVALIQAPQGMLARVFSFIPFTAPTTMMFRYAVDPAGTPWTDIAGSVAILVLSTILAVRLAARLYRAGALLYGKRPGVREIWRWLKATP